VPKHYYYPIPENMDLTITTMIPIAFNTTYDTLFTYDALQPKKTVLMQSATNDINLTAIQLAAQTNTTVIGTTSSPEHLARVTALGMHHGIDYKREDIAARCREITGDKGVDLVLDLAGGQGKDALCISTVFFGWSAS
jgi:NADPH:quinone reductase and related Zn-dependent oxidoreductases